MRRTFFALILLAVWIAPAWAEQSPAARLSTARELYASARYEEALALLNGLQPAQTGTSVDRRAIAQYRSLCLLALGRGAEAEEAIAAVVTADPMYKPDEADASPRVRSAFHEVRQRVLPGIALSLYGAAKRLYDRKDLAAAAEAFKHVLRLLDDPDMKGQQADLRVLATGFLELSVAEATRPDDPKTDVDQKADTEPAPVSVVPAANRVYTADDAGVSPAVPIKQELPRVPSSIASQVRPQGVIEVVIDELGRVTFVAIRSAMHPMYDGLVLGAAREWRYRPATFAGAPVKFRKLIQISLAKR
jgi:hypothetical protein